jgi:hypothetical protein
MDKEIGKEELSKKVVALIKLKKKIAELNLLSSYFSINGENTKAANVKRELSSLDQELEELEKQLDNIVLPFSNRLKELNKALADYSEKEIIESLKTKTGELYSLLVKRGEIIRIHDKRANEIGKLNEFLMFYDGNKDKIRKAIEDGSFEETIEVSDESKAKTLAILLNRMNIFCKVEGNKLVPAKENHYEDLVEFENECFWVKKGKVDEFKTLLAELNSIKRKIQLLNAERQIRKFSEGEEAEFIATQSRYLELLKKRDELTNPLPDL